MIQPLIASMVLLLAGGASDRPAAPGFVLPIDGPGREIIADVDETHLRSRAVSIDFDRLHDIGPFAREAVAVALFDDVMLVPVFERFMHRAADRYTWVGSLRDDPDGWFVLAVERDALVANFWTGDGRAFEISPTPEGQPGHLAREILPQKFGPCETCRNQEVNSPVEPGGARQVGGVGDEGGAAGGAAPCDGEGDPTIDVLVVWTPAARSAQGGTNAIIALIEAAVAATNNAYNNSEVTARIRLVHAAETAYAESGSFNTDLTRLRVNGDGYMDEVHLLRNQFGADMVALINNTNTSCGIGYLMTTLSPGFEAWAFSVTRRTCAVGNLTFAHELGHNMGCAHDHDNAGGALFSFSYGHRWTTTTGILRRSVMAYPPGTRVPHFSNPEVLNGGVPTGIPQGQPQAADNARSINIAAPTVAAFRPSLCGPPENNSCQSAIFISAGTHAFDTAGATTQGPNEPEHCNYSGDTNIQNDIWFNHLVQCTGELTISLCGSSFPTKLGIYGGICPTGPGQILHCDAGGCSGLHAEISMPVIAGQGIRIRIGGHNGATGEGVLTLTCTPDPNACPADLNGDNAVDVQDLLVLLSAWGSCAGAPACDADLNGDGDVDVQDLLMLLSAWGSCP